MGSFLRGSDFTKPLLAAIAAWLIASFGLGVIWAAPSAREAQAIQITRGPYLQDVTPDSALVCWEADAPHSGAVFYGSTANYGSVASTETADKSHCVRLPDLASYALYHYQVWGEGTALSPDATFRTLAGKEQDSINFVAWGDVRTNHPIHRQLAGLVEEAAPDFVINVGDMVESGRRMSDWDVFFDVERELLASAPLYPALGNHEEDSPLYFSLFTLPGNERWYSFDSGPAHLVALDVLFSAFGPGSEQYAWLERDLRETTRPWKIVFLHYPPYSFSQSRGGVPAVKEALAPLFEKYGVQFVLSGHDHYYQRNVVNGVTYIVTGGGGAPLHIPATSPWTLYTEQTYQFLKVSIKGDLLTSTGVRLDGSYFDPFSLRLITPEGEGIGPLQTPMVVVPAATQLPIGLIETWSCRRCHDPFRLDNLRLLAYGWEFHHWFIVGGGLALAFIILTLAAISRGLHLKAKRGTGDDTPGKAHP
ncbi:MAG: metallophosphoesterase family protein [Chloroflexi bacterium]|nr:metallophosphoesterase family protein [Chloroflexota bacterium]